MEQKIISSIFAKIPTISNHNSLQTISIDNSSILVHIDTKTFANPVKQKSSEKKFKDESTKNNSNSRQNDRDQRGANSLPHWMKNPKFRFQFLDEPLTKNIPPYSSPRDDESTNNEPFYISLRADSTKHKLVFSSLREKPTNNKPLYGYQRDETKSENTKSIKNKGTRKCVMGCIDSEMLHRVPQDETGEIWRKKLKLSILRKSNRLCERHFKKSFASGRKRLAGWELPDTPEPTDSEENLTANKHITNFFKKFRPSLQVKLLSVSPKNDEQTKVYPTKLHVNKPLSRKDNLACN